MSSPPELHRRGGAEPRQVGHSDPTAVSGAPGLCGQRVWSVSSLFLSLFFFISSSSLPFSYVFSMSMLNMYYSYTSVYFTKIGLFISYANKMLILFYCLIYFHKRTPPEMSSVNIDDLFISNYYLYICAVLYIDLKFVVVVLSLTTVCAAALVNSCIVSDKT